jgi:hypothetical protein
MSLKDGKDTVEFEMVDVANRKLKVLGIINIEKGTYDSPPSPFVKDEIVTLAEGVYPLTDYMDTSYHKAHTYVLERADGTQIRGILHGFSYDCTYAGAKTGGNPAFSVLIPKSTNTTNTANTASNSSSSS